MRIRLRASLGIVFATLFVSTVAYAQDAPAVQLAQAESVNCNIRSIHGAPSGSGSIDKRLSDLKKQLRRAPFSAFRSMRLVASKSLLIPQGGSKRLSLPSGKLLRLKFKEKLLQKGKVRLRMHLSITPPRAKKFLPGTQFSIANGGTLLVAGDKYRRGTLVVGITCKAK